MAEIGKWGTEPPSATPPSATPLSATPTKKGVAPLKVINMYSIKNFWFNGLGFIQIGP